MTLALLLLSGITLLLLGGHYLVRHAVELAADLNVSLLVIGSTIFNLLGIAGIIALVSPIDVGAQLIETDIGILLAARAGVAILTMHLVGWTAFRAPAAHCLCNIYPAARVSKACDFSHFLSSWRSGPSSRTQRTRRHRSLNASYVTP